MLPGGNAKYCSRTIRARSPPPLQCCSATSSILMRFPAMRELELPVDGGHRAIDEHIDAPRMHVPLLDRREKGALLREQRRLSRGVDARGLVTRRVVRVVGVDRLDELPRLDLRTRASTLSKAHSASPPLSKVQRNLGGPPFLRKSLLAHVNSTTIDHEKRDHERRASRARPDGAAQRRPAAHGVVECGHARGRAQRIRRLLRAVRAQLGAALE